jgi:hypothetical protein
VDTAGLVLKAKVHSAKVDGTGDDVVDCGESFVPSENDEVIYDLVDQVAGNCETQIVN